jgi:hypothetical protein
MIYDCCWKLTSKLISLQIKCNLVHIQINGVLHEGHDYGETCGAQLTTASWNIPSFYGFHHVAVRNTGCGGLTTSFTSSVSAACFSLVLPSLCLFHQTLFICLHLLLIYLYHLLLLCFFCPLYVHFNSHLSKAAPETTGWVDRLKCDCFVGITTSHVCAFRILLRVAKPLKTSLEQ